MRDSDTDPHTDPYAGGAASSPNHGPVVVKEGSRGGDAAPHTDPYPEEPSGGGDRGLQILEAIGGS